ncbi:hypothetical protein DY000_02024763 [Brassica cretica]|uniref:Uncharacterized protein n=1 Tax=Brassica cretica TaxID=69181 RepID=A0ABQ7E0R9_BRACR|nr:hypothetical protein DY000_02024763 [Brassica cretica]
MRIPIETHSDSGSYQRVRVIYTTCRVNTPRAHIPNLRSSRSDEEEKEQPYWNEHSLRYCKYAAPMCDLMSPEGLPLTKQKTIKSPHTQRKHLLFKDTNAPVPELVVHNILLNLQIPLGT